MIGTRDSHVKDLGRRVGREKLLSNKDSACINVLKATMFDIAANRLLVFPCAACAEKAVSFA